MEFGSLYNAAAFGTALKLLQENSDKILFCIDIYILDKTLWVLTRARGRRKKKE
jgi:hypothetical protein